MCVVAGVDRKDSIQCVTFDCPDKSHSLPTWPVRFRPSDSSGSAGTARASGSCGLARREPWFFAAVSVVRQLDGAGIRQVRRTEELSGVPSKLTAVPAPSLATDVAGALFTCGVAPTPGRSPCSLPACGWRHPACGRGAPRNREQWCWRSRLPRRSAYWTGPAPGHP